MIRRYAAPIVDGGPRPADWYVHVVGSALRVNARVRRDLERRPS